MTSRKLIVDDYMNFDYPFVVIPFSDDEFSGYRAFLIDIPAIESIGITKEEALEDLDDVKREWIAYALDKGIIIPEPDTSFPETLTYSGRVTLRMPKTLHRQASEKALFNGVSLNTYLNEVIQRGMSSISNDNYYSFDMQNIVNNEFRETLDNIYNSIKESQEKTKK